ncbi:hypothetical protein MMC29_005437 [Sticta canariensis]|nr:hypothetical protein [Sticta canariensis]
MVEEKEISAESSEGTESQQARRRPLAEDEWLQKKSLEWDCRETRKAKAKEDSGFKKDSGNNLSATTETSDEDSEGHGDALYEWDEPIDFFDYVWAAGTHGRVSISSINSGRQAHTVEYRFLRLILGAGHTVNGRQGHLEFEAEFLSVLGAFWRRRGSLDGESIELTLQAESWIIITSE